MRELIVSVLITLDGVVEAPGGEPGHPHTGWAGELMGPDEVSYKLGEVQEAESLLIGRITYESFAGVWPEREGEFADRMNSMRKHVVSTTLRDPEWENTEVIRDEVVDSIRQLRETDGGPILVNGSGTLVRLLTENDLVDEYRLMTFPVVVGGGQRLFADNLAKTELTLADTRTFSSGVIVLSYRRAAPAG